MAEQKNVMRSWTFWGGLVLAIGAYFDQYTQTNGVGEMPTWLIPAVEALGGLVMALGFRKAINPNITLPGSK